MTSQQFLHPSIALTDGSFFDQEAFSDITIKFGTRERKCHRMILCSKSEYFKEMRGPGKAFAEAQQSVIELKDDVNEEAV